MINILHRCNCREKACSNCGWKHQCKCYYAFPVLSHIGCWHRSVSVDCQWQSRSVVYWLTRVIWSHRLHPRKSPSELLCEIIPTPFGTFAVWQLTPEIDWTASVRICTSDNPSRNLRLPRSSGLTSYCLSFTGEFAGALLPHRHTACTFICLASLCICASSLPKTPGWAFCSPATCLCQLLLPQIW